MPLDDWTIVDLVDEICQNPSQIFEGVAFKKGQGFYSLPRYFFIFPSGKPTLRPSQKAPRTVPETVPLLSVLEVKAPPVTAVTGMAVMTLTTALFPWPLIHVGTTITAKIIVVVVIKSLTSVCKDEVLTLSALPEIVS